MHLAVSEDGLLGIVMGFCAYILDTESMKIVDKVCGKYAMRNASYSHGVFAFMNWYGHVHLFKGGKYWKKVKTDWMYRKAVTVLPDGFVACDTYCAKFTFDGRKVWDREIEMAGHKIAVHRGYVYVPNMWNKELIVLGLDDGDVVNKIKYGEAILTVTVCRDYLAVGGDEHLYLYDIADPANPVELWMKDGFYVVSDVAFSPDCNTMAVCDERNQRLVLFSLKGDFMGEVEYDSRPLSAAWGRDVLAVEVLRNGKTNIYVQKLEKV